MDRRILKIVCIVLSKAKDILVCSSYAEVHKTRSRTWRTANQSHLRIKRDKRSVADGSTAEDGVGG